MQSVSTPLHRLHEDGSWFARAQELRLWLVRCDESLRGTTLSLIPKLEFHADNHSPWPVLADAHTTADDGWALRANRLVADWSRRVEAFNKEGISQGTVELPDGRAALELFIRAAQDVLAAMRAPLAGLVVVLAPGVVERPEALESALTGLLGHRELMKIRWVLVLDVDATVPRALVDALGEERALVTECAIDRVEQRRELAAMLAPGDPARFGVAYPVGVTAPPRVDDPPALPVAQRDAALRAAGVDPQLLDRGPELRAEVIGAALAMAEGRGAVALQHQRRARDLCERLGLVEMTIITRIILASYLSGLDQRQEAKRELQTAIAAARTHGQARAESQAHLALGLLHNLDRDQPSAIRAYMDAARAAEAGDEPLLAIEGWRMAGQLAAQSQHGQQAEQAFREALRVASEAEPQVASGSSAAEAARQLAALYSRRGMTAQAESLHAQADALEQREDEANAGE